MLVQVSKAAAFQPLVRAPSELEVEAVIDTLTGTLTKIQLTPRGAAQGWTEPLLEQACHLLGLFDDLPDNGIRLNLSVSYPQLKQPGFRKAVASVLTRTQVNPKVLELSVAAEEVEASYVLNELSDLGLTLALHGFGEGRASLGIFETVPLSSVSLSPSLTRKLCSPLKTPHYAIAVVSCLMSMSQLLDFALIACGADDHEQVRSLRNLGCTLQQGTFYASPVRLGREDMKATLEAAWLGIL